MPDATRTFHLTARQAKRVHHCLTLGQAELLKAKKEVAKSAMDEKDEKRLTTPLDEDLLEFTGKELGEPGLLSMFAEQTTLRPADDGQHTLDDEIRRQASAPEEDDAVEPPEVGTELHGADGTVIDTVDDEAAEVLAPGVFRVTGKEIALDGGTGASAPVQRIVRRVGNQWHVLPDDWTPGEVPSESGMTHIGDVVDDVQNKARSARRTRKRHEHRKAGK